MTSPGRCDRSELCDEILSTKDNTFTATYRDDPPSRRIHSTPDLRLVADLSPLTLGHMLLLPERHYLSFGHLIPDLAEPVMALIEHLLPIYRTTFGQAVILEHGSSSEMPSACITHAHWHIVPLDGGHLCRLIRSDGLDPIHLGHFSDLRRFADADQPYYYCYDGRNHTAFDARRRPRAQYLRSVMGAALGIADPEWDWSVVIRKDLLRATMRMTRHWGDQLPST